MTRQDSTTALIRIGAEEFASLGSQWTIAPSEKEMVTAAERIGGLITTPEALALYRLCQRLQTGSRVLEIGSYLGTSTTAIGKAIVGRNIELYCLDCWHDYQAQGFFEHTLPGGPKSDSDIFSTFQKNTCFLGEQLRILKGSTNQFKHFLPAQFFDLIFIDAAHDYKSVLNDLIISMRALTPGGLLIGHDYHSDGHGVINAVNQILYESKSITVKGLIPNTSIWYALIDNPIQELTSITISRIQHLNSHDSALRCF